MVGDEAAEEEDEEWTLTEMETALQEAMDLKDQERLMELLDEAEEKASTKNPKP